jgi:hypothetical protein
MAYSNTTGETKINVDQLISYACREAGKTAEEMTPEYVQAAKQALFYNLMDLSNMGVNLWLLENQLYGTVTAQQELTLPKTTIDVREANWVYVQNIGISQALPVNSSSAASLFDQNLDTFATSTTGENWFGAAYSPDQAVFYVGFNAYVPGNNTALTTTYNLAYETSDDLITWTTRQVFPATTLHDREWAYFNISTTPNYTYYRLRETVATTFSLRQIVFSQSQQVIPLARLNRDDYWSLPNKQFASNRSLQFWFDRQIEPSMYLWPVPDNDFQMFQLIVEKQMQDVGSLTNEVYVPDRWIACIQAQLSHKLSLQLPGVDLQRIQYLEAQANKLFMHASEEDRDKSPIYLQPNFSYYTR